MKHKVNTKENRLKECQEQISLLQHELLNPDNFVQNQYSNTTDVTTINGDKGADYGN